MLITIILVKFENGGLVITIMKTIEKRQQELCVQQLVLEAHEARLSGEKDYSLEESKNLINDLIKNVNE